MWEPTSVVPGSIMPAYKPLYSTNTDFETAYAEAYTQKVVFGVPYDTKGGVELGSVDQAKANYLKEAGVIVADMNDPKVAEAYKKGEVPKIVALIAYLNSLGQSRRVAQGQ